MTTIRIYVASLSDYNAGILHGTWLDVTDADTLREGIATMLAQSPIAAREGNTAEEWAVHDYECDAGRLRMGEYPDLDDLCRLADALDEHGAAFLAFWDNESGTDVDVDRFQECYRGSWRSLEEYAEQLLDDLGTFQNVPDMLKTYFDFEAFARDLELGGDIWTAGDPEGGIFVFDNR